MGRPVSRYLDDGLTLEVNRLCTTGAENACSMLYGAAARAARAMGYQKIITYTLDTEPEAGHIANVGHVGEEFFRDRHAGRHDLAGP